MRLATLSLLLLLPTICRADWYVIGAAYKCDKTHKSLTIEAVADSSNEELIIPAKRGFKEFKTGETRVRCNVGKLPVTAVVTIHDPAGRGYCAGIGYVFVDIRSKNKQSMFGDTAFFNHCMTNGRMNVKVALETKNDRPEMTVCSASDIDGDQFKDYRCETKNIELKP